MLEQSLLDGRMTYLIHLFHYFLDFKHLLMFLMSLGGMKASTIVQVRNLLHWTPLHFVCGILLPELQGWAGEEEGVFSSQV